MPARLRPLEPADLPRVVDLSLRAWEPVFTSLRTVLGDEVFQRLYPDWRSDQERAVTATCTSTLMNATVADEAGAPVGFVAFAADPATRLTPPALPRPGRRTPAASTAGPISPPPATHCSKPSR